MLKIATGHDDLLAHTAPALMAAIFCVLVLIFGSQVLIDLHRSAQMSTSGFGIQFTPVRAVGTSTIARIAKRETGGAPLFQEWGPQLNLAVLTVTLMVFAWFGATPRYYYMLGWRDVLHLFLTAFIFGVIYSTVSTSADHLFFKYDSTLSGIEAYPDSWLYKLYPPWSHVISGVTSIRAIIVNTTIIGFGSIFIGLVSKKYF